MSHPGLQCDDNSVFAHLKPLQAIWTGSGSLFLEEPPKVISITVKYLFFFTQLLKPVEKISIIHLHANSITVAGKTKTFSLSTYEAHCQGNDSRNNLMLSLK